MCNGDSVVTRMDKSPSRTYFGFETGNLIINYYVEKAVVLNINYIPSI